MSWNDDLDAHIKKLWEQGFSASQISARIKGKSRNAVIGRLHRIGCKGRGSPIVRKKPPPRKPSAPSAVNPPSARPSPLPRPPGRASAVLFRPEFESSPFVIGEELDIPLNERRTIATMTDKDCRWPIGDPRHADFHFCNRNKVPGLPYCEFHARRAFQPPQPRRRDVAEPVVAKPKLVEEV